MQTVYLVKGLISGHPEFLSGIFSTTTLADKYIEDCKQINDNIDYKVENWNMDFFS